MDSTTDSPGLSRAAALGLVALGLSLVLHAGVLGGFLMASAGATSAPPGRSRENAELTRLDPAGVAGLAAMAAAFVLAAVVFSRVRRCPWVRSSRVGHVENSHSVSPFLRVCR